MPNVAEHMLYSTKDKNENMALEVCEFWLTFAEDADLAAYLRPLLGKAAPLEGDADDAAVPDKEQDIKPRHYGGKAHGLEHDPSEGGDAPPKLRIGVYGEEQIDSWNLRKCAAAALHVFAVRFGADLLNVLLAPLKDELWSSDWLQRETGILALGVMAEEDPEPLLTPYLEPVLRKLMLGFDLYQDKNMLILYDAVGTFANAVGRALQDPRYIDILMPPLTAKWSNLRDEDEKLIPSLECLASVTIAIGQAFLPYASPVFERCNSILVEPDKSFPVVALDLLSGLTQGLGPQLKPVIQISQPNLLNLLTVYLKHPQAPVQQFAYSLVGYLEMRCFSLLRGHMPGIMAELILQLDPEPKLEFIFVSIPPAIHERLASRFGV
ncbi:hypothetical protein C0989_000203 [Termitomyces sp. Mn162]|nr:hypothetical protein C0989_000203 [Termitomyces sp. Mn162]